MRHLLTGLALSWALSLTSCTPDVAPEPPPPIVDASVPRDAPVAVLRDAGQPLPSDDPFAIAPRPTELRLTRGTTAPIAVQVTRAPGFTSSVSIRSRGLPPGIEVSRATVRGEDTEEIVMVAVAQDAPVGFWPFALTAQADGWLHEARIALTVE